MTKLPVATPIHYVTDTASLAGCMATLSAAPAFAFDLEFDRDRYTYGFDLCLMQIATPTTCFVIDPLASLHLQPLFLLFENPAIRKLVHCPGEDLRLLHSLQCYPNNLVDTDVYAKLLNYEQTSLSNMLQIHCGVELNKKLQTSNWARRPLSDAQIEYAAADVLYLFELEEKLRKELEAKGLLAFAEEEFALVNNTRYTLEPKENFLKKNDLQFMSPYDQYVLNELFKYRDGLAREKNKPAHQILPEELVRQIAYNKLPVQALASQTGVHPMLKSPGGIQRLLKRWQAIHAEAKAANLSHRRSGQGLTPSERQEFEAIRLAQDNAKKQIFTPIQQRIAEKYGQHMTRFVFSSTLVNELLKGDRRINSIQPAYRQRLVREAATSLQLDISPWI